MTAGKNIWTQVDHYAEASLLPADPAMDAVLERNRASGLPAIDVSPLQGKFLDLVVRMCGARRVLEIGTLGGYSTIWMARALPAGGTVVTLELEERHAAVANQNFATAGVSDRVDLRVGLALSSLEKLGEEEAGPFDLIFIDADKPNNERYLIWAMRLARPGTVIICDNVIRDGAVIEAESRDASVQGARDVFSFFGSRGKLEATALQTVGEKGYDGFAMAIVGEG
ncbi:MAG: O-methyltransferase [Hyphomicrobiales bacterium]|nr:O-methyltransferase [Hyphomicrobiales bacterium]